MPIALEIRSKIEIRDQKRCQYCLTTEDNCGLRMHIDHILPESAGGGSSLDNLCLACFSCNVHKGAKQIWNDPETQEAVKLFNPMVQNWNDHFGWDENKTRIIGHTPCGRATIDALRMNNSTVIKARRRWVSAGWHPPDV